MCEVKSIKQDSKDSDIIPDSRSIQVVIKSMLSVFFAYLHTSTWSKFGKVLFWIISVLIAIYIAYVIFTWAREIFYWVKRKFHPLFDLALFCISILAAAIALFLLNYSIQPML
jgi:hypothetical protein